MKTGRAYELCNLFWRDVDLANGRLFIGRSRTPAGLREIRMLPVLRDILAAVLRRADELLEHRGLVPPPRGLTSHKLRHAFARSWSPAARTRSR